MGKGSRTRSARRTPPTPTSWIEAGAAFGLGGGWGPAANAGDPASLAPVVAAADNPERAGPHQAWARVESGLEHLAQLGADRAAARHVVAELDEEIAAAAGHLRVDGANWAQIGRALGISRQGARQAFETRDRRRDR